MFKMVFGNLLFFGILFGWYLYVDGDRSLMLSGVILGFGCFLSGIFMGYILHSPPKRRVAQTDVAFDPVPSAEIEQTAAESQRVSVESTAVDASDDHQEQLDKSDASAAESESVAIEIAEPSAPVTTACLEQHTPIEPVAVVESTGESGARTNSVASP